MNLSDEEIRSGYLERVGRPMQDRDLAAFKRMCAYLQVEPENYKDGAERLMASFEIAAEFGFSEEQLSSGYTYDT